MSDEPPLALIADICHGSHIQKKIEIRIGYQKAAGEFALVSSQTEPRNSTEKRRLIKPSGKRGTIWSLWAKTSRKSVTVLIRA